MKTLYDHNTRLLKLTRYLAFESTRPQTQFRSASSAVRILEVGPRDGLQNISTIVPLQTKVDLIHKLAATGVLNIEATSFVSPKWIPQLADAAEVMKQISDLNTQRISVLTPNQKGFDNAMQSGAKEVVVFASATEAFSSKNQNCSVEQALEGARQIVRQAKQQGVWARGVVSCIFGDPYSGPTSPQDVLKVVKAFIDMGCDEVGLGDTLGIGTPQKTQALLELLLKDVSALKLTGHFHDTYGQAVANVMRAYELGIRSFDSSVAGLGGCPYAPGARGNAATEDIVYMFENSGISTGIDLEKLSIVGDWISKQLGLLNNSRAGTALAAKQQSQKRDTVTTARKEPGAYEKPQSEKTDRKWTMETQAEGYTVARAGNSVKITLTRPKNGNAMTKNMLVSLTELFEDLATDPMTFHIVLAAEGKYFCTGMDLTGDSRDNSSDYHDMIVRLFRAIDEAPQITIAAFQGPAFGGGVGLGFVCDVRLATMSTKWKLAEIKLGLSPAIISKYMSREWGLPFFREAMLSGREVGTEELIKFGAIHGIAETTDGLADLVDQYLDQLKTSAPRAAATCKQLLRHSFIGPGSEAQDLYIQQTFDKMLIAGSEGQFGIANFQRKIKDIDWSMFHGGKRAKL